MLRQCGFMSALRIFRNSVCFNQSLHSLPACAKMLLGFEMTSFQFLHAADIHLDSPLIGLSKHEGTVAKRIRSATREAFDRLVGMAIEERVDFLIIAGDLYDGDWRDYKTGLFFVEQMGRLNAAAVPVYLLYGNHDAASQITKRLVLPDNVHEFGTRKPKSFHLGEIKVAIHGQSYRQRNVTDNLVLDYPDPVPNVFNIGVLHTGLGGMGGHADYAPCSIHDLENKGYDYWALGHVHKAEVLSERPYIVFPGNLQGRHVRETGAKGACLVAVEECEIVNFTFESCDVVRWLKLPVSLDDVHSMAEINDRIRNAIETAIVNESDGRMLVCRIFLKGRTKFHSQIVALEEDVLVEARASALGFGDGVAWIEKVVVRTDDTIDPEILVRREDAIGELQRLLQEAGSDKELLAQLQRDTKGLIRRLPYEVWKDTEHQLLKLAHEENYKALIDNILPYLFARLSVWEE